MSEPRAPGVPATDVGTATVGPSDRPETKARPPSRGRGPAPRPRWPRWRPWMAEALVLAGFLAAGVLVTWPRAAYLAGRMPANSDQAQYVWNLWWVAHQLAHLGNPWFTSRLAAPVGIPLGFGT